MRNILLKWVMIKLKNIKKSYKLGKTNSVEVLKWIDLNIEAWEFVAIVWPSWSWKSTLMNIIWMLDLPTSWQYFLDKLRVDNLSDSKQSDIRSKKIWFIFQNYSLLPRINAVNQVMIPLEYQWYSSFQAKKMTIKQLERVWLWDKLKNNPNELSWWQSQRVAIARALVINPEVLLADEPTWALDSKTWEEILNLFKKINNEWKTVIIITHDKWIAAKASRIINIKDGEIYED